MGSLQTTFPTDEAPRQKRKRKTIQNIHKTKTRIRINRTTTPPSHKLQKMHNDTKQYSKTARKISLDETKHGHKGRNEHNFFRRQNTDTTDKFYGKNAHN